MIKKIITRVKPKFIKKNNLAYKLKLFIKSNDQIMVNKYHKAVLKHNKQSHNPNAGFDLFLPFGVVSEEDVQLIDLKVIAAMYKHNKRISYYLYPRSSIYKTNFRLANSVGIIDSGYTGNIKIALDSIGDGESLKYDRLVQVCNPYLEHFEIEIVESDSILLRETGRGKGGFGSTGR